MGRIPFLKSIAIFLFLNIVYSSRLRAQAPVVSYATPQVYTSGTSITPLSPATSTGVSSLSYSSSVINLGSGFLNQPEGAAIDGSGNIYVNDFGTGTVKRITSANSATTIASGFSFVSGGNDIAVDASG